MGWVSPGLGVFPLLEFFSNILIEHNARLIWSRYEALERLDGRVLRVLAWPAAFSFSRIAFAIVREQINSVRCRTIS